MYSVGIFANISELTTFPFANIKVFAEEKFLPQNNKENCEYSLYTKDQKEVFLAKVQTGGFDGIVFATNTANDDTLKEYFEGNKEAFHSFLEAGKGILILMQYHAAIDNSFFNILSENDFPDLNKSPITTKQINIAAEQNNVKKVTPIKSDKGLFKYNPNEFILKYPRNVIEEEPNNDSEEEPNNVIEEEPNNGSENKANNDSKKAPSFLGAMKKNSWQVKSSPLYVYIDSYPESDFRSIIGFNTEAINNIWVRKKINGEQKASREKSFCIVSRNANKRVAIATLALDLENNYLLENLITYITKGVPTVFFRACNKCGEKNETCDYVDLLNSTKIHFSDDENIKQLAKYEILNCEQSKDKTSSNISKVKEQTEEKSNCEQSEAKEKEQTEDKPKNVIPIKQIMPMDDSGGRICRCVNTSSVRYMCELGAHYLSTQLNKGKYGSLIGTLMTLRLFKEIGFEIQDADKKAIFEYLKKHNGDRTTFDSITESTRRASEVLTLLGGETKSSDETKSSGETKLKTSLNNENVVISFEITADNNNNEAADNNKNEPYTLGKLKELKITDVARILGEEQSNDKTPFNFNKSCKNNSIKEFLLKVFAQIISYRDAGCVSWENDCYMTALMLIVLLNIEKWFEGYDKRHHTNCTAKINVIAAYFEEETETALYNALVKSADSERSKAYEFAGKLRKKEKEYNEISEERDKLKQTKYDFESVGNRVRQHQTINIILSFLIISLVVLCVIFVLRAHYGNENIYEFLLDLQPIEIILSIAGVIVVPFTIGSIYWGSKKKEPSSKKKEPSSSLRSKIKRLFHKKNGEKKPSEDKK